ncbi:TPA: hypothetical protein TVL50_000853 [Streptococcus equi subsp. zooepidemicus]|nr:hypothetical protein [Streptococcus equi subsp. zooepidemicus]
MKTIDKKKQLLRKAIDAVLSDKEVALSLFGKSTWFKENLISQVYYLLTVNAYFYRYLKTEVTTTLVTYLVDRAYRNNQIIYREPPCVGAAIVEEVLTSDLAIEIENGYQQFVEKFIIEKADELGKRYFEIAFYMDLDFLEEMLKENEFICSGEEVG